MKQLIITAIIILISWLASTFIRPLVKHMYEENMPAPKKQISYIKNALVFSIRFVLPSIVLLLNFLFEDFDKLFVFRVLFFSALIAYNYLSDKLSEIHETFGDHTTVAYKQVMVIDALRKRLKKSSLRKLSKIKKEKE